MNVLPVALILTPRIIVAVPFRIRHQHTLEEDLMRRRYVTADVFTSKPFEGNPVAVVLDAQGLSTQQMQSIATEFAYSETTFVLPPRDPKNTAHVRIFTPSREIPFAGHPNIGTAFVLGSIGELGEIKSSATATFEEEAGLVSIAINESGEKIVSCELTAPQSLSLGKTLPIVLVA